MTRSDAFCADNLVLAALAADPVGGAGYDLAAEVQLKSGSLYPILIVAVRSRAAGLGVGAGSARKAAAARLPTHRPAVWKNPRASSGRSVLSRSVRLRQQWGQA